MLTRRMLLPLLSAAAVGCSPSKSSAPPATEDGGTPTDGGGGVTPVPPADGDNGGGVREETPPVLVVVFQRFAADWINMLVPAGDSAYAGLRPSLRINNPLALDGFFGLHPSLTDLQTLYNAGDLAFVCATGWIPTDSRDRSHFYAQSLAESGARSGVSGGWLGRFLNRDTLYNEDLWAAIAAEKSVPSSLQGFQNAIAISNFAEYTHGSVAGDAVTALLGAFAQSVGEPADTLLRLAESVSAVSAEPPPVSDVAYPATTLGNGLKLAAQAIRAGFAPRVITVTSDDDWDTHVNQSSRHEQSLPKFAGALSAFHQDLGDQMDHVVVVTMTEFGRKARENLGGTDHGTASSMLVMGRSIAGGKVYGQWPGLSDDALYQGEDLEPTTDYRSVLGEILSQHMGMTDASIEQVFPGGYAARSNWRQFFR